MKTETKEVKKLSFFDHVKHIRQVQDPLYYVKLSDDDKKTFNHFMIIRALSMDEDLVEDMANLYIIFDKIPSPQFYQLLIALVPKSNKYCQWIKTKKFKNTKELIKIVADRFTVPGYQANEYINLLLRTEDGQNELIDICKGTGLSDKEIEEMFAKE